MARLLAIMLETADPTILKRAETQYGPSGDYYQISDMVGIVYTAKEPAVVKSELRIGEPPTDATKGGVVFSLNGAYSGFFRRSLIDWLQSKPL